jgi:hypothetical protein
MTDGESLKKPGNIDGHCPLRLLLNGSPERDDVTFYRLHQLDQATVGRYCIPQGFPQPLQSLPERGSGLGFRGVPPKQPSQFLPGVGAAFEHHVSEKGQRLSTKGRHDRATVCKVDGGWTEQGEEDTRQTIALWWVLQRTPDSRDGKWIFTLASRRDLILIPCS